MLLFQFLCEFNLQQSNIALYVFQLMAELLYQVTIKVKRNEHVEPVDVDRNILLSSWKLIVVNKGFYQEPLKLEQSRTRLARLILQKQIEF